MKPATNRIEDALVTVTILRSHPDIPRLSISPSRSAHNASNARHSTTYIAHCGIQPQTNLGEYTLDLLWIQSEYNDTRPRPYHDRRCGFSLTFPALVSPHLVIRSGFPIPSLSSLSSPPSPSTRPPHCPVPGFLNLLQGHFDVFELGWYTVDMSSSPIWHRLSKLTVYLTAVAPMRLLHSLSSVNILRGGERWPVLSHCRALSSLLHGLQ